jgi:hypothetical protein
MIVLKSRGKFLQLEWLRKKERKDFGFPSSPKVLKKFSYYLVFFKRFAMECFAIPP